MNPVRDISAKSAYPVVPPFLKWAGGKRWLVERFSNLFPLRFERLIEPFLGSGAVFFHLQPDTALLGDLNAELINAFRAIKEQPDKVIHLLKQHQLKHATNYYYEIRKKRFVGLAERAAQFIYLNRTCFNAIYRVNLRGEFNVPKGDKSAVILKTDNFRATSKFLRNAELVVADFSDLIGQASAGDFVYVDPPYTVRHNCNGFKKYNEEIFSWNDQVRLAELLNYAVERGAKVMVSNADHQEIRALYDDKVWNIQSVARASVIASKSKHRGNYREIAVRNYE